MTTQAKAFSALNMSPINAKQFQRVFLLSTVATCIAVVLMVNHNVALNVIGAALLVAAQAWFFLGIFRRNRDIGNPWYYSLICIVPVIGLLYFLWLLMASSVEQGRTGAGA